MNCYAAEILTYQHVWTKENPPDSHQLHRHALRQTILKVKWKHWKWQWRWVWRQLQPIVYLVEPGQRFLFCETIQVASTFRMRRLSHLSMTKSQKNAYYSRCKVNLLPLWYFSHNFDAIVRLKVTKLWRKGGRYDNNEFPGKGKRELLFKSNIYILPKYQR